MVSSQTKIANNGSESNIPVDLLKGNLVNGWEKGHQTNYLNFSTYECVPLTVSYHLYFLLTCKGSSMLHQGSVGRVHGKEYYFYTYIYFLGIFLLFYIKKYAFIIFYSFSDAVSNFCNRILTNQKSEQVIRNCQRNCMLYFLMLSNQFKGTLMQI